jgi:hypothetical protein
MCAFDRKWERHNHFLPTTYGSFHFRLAAHSGHKSRLAQYDLEGTALVTTEQKGRERVLQIALRLFARVALRMNIEQVTRRDKPFPLFSYLRGELEFHRGLHIGDLLMLVS